MVHGFAGYFHCELYAGQGMCTLALAWHRLECVHQPRELLRRDVLLVWRPRMWLKRVLRFPIYFPLRTPVNLKRGEKLSSVALG